MPVESVAVESVPVEEEVSNRILHEIYEDQVREIYPHGTTFYCTRSGCGHSMSVTAHQLAEITAVGGWPKHCGADMRIGDHVMEDLPVLPFQGCCDE